MIRITVQSMQIWHGTSTSFLGFDAILGSRATQTHASAIFHERRYMSAAISQPQSVMLTNYSEQVDFQAAPTLMPFRRSAGANKVGG